jgi:hypothetical protein
MLSRTPVPTPLCDVTPVRRPTRRIRQAVADT